MRTLVFSCSQCGECCSHMGLVHTVKEEYGRLRFLVRNEYTGEENVVAVDPDKTALFRDRSIFTSVPEACPFFRRSPADGKGYCTVHLTRPEICRDYGCWRLLILDSRGRRAGRIMYQRYFVSEDDTLTVIWSQMIERITEPDDNTWDSLVISILKQAGYRVIR